MPVELRHRVKFGGDRLIGQTVAKISRFLFFHVAAAHLERSA